MMTEVELEIKTLSKKGHGRGYYRDKAVDIPGALPDERALVEIPKRVGRKGSGRLLSIIKASPHRVPERCPHASYCGGCAFQSLQYREQLEHKQSVVEALFERKAPAIISCETPFYGRNKMEYTFSENRAGERFLGLIMKGTRGHVFNLTECHMTTPWFSEALCAVRNFWFNSDLRAYHGPSDSGHLRTLMLRESHYTGERMAVLTVSGNADFALSKTHLEKFKEALVAIDLNMSIFLRIQQICKGKPTQFYEMHLHGATTITEKLSILGRTLEFTVSPTSFFQPQTLQAEKLYTRALELLAPQPEDILYDLYCGTGTLAIAMAPHVKHVIAIELNPYAVYDAEKNASANGLSNIMFYAADVAEKLAELKALDRGPDLIIVDPPRSGLSLEAIELLAASGARKILYISCNPLTQKENVEALKGVYELNEIQPLDQFPHSPHIENIALLVKRT